ncbi:MAG: hypothetical protein OEY66_07810 [Gammaproteobacteria bacterium]|nr:hypothetical protein [Gammaproteobacteria bacterium]
MSWSILKNSAYLILLVMAIFVSGKSVSAENQENEKPHVEDKTNVCENLRGEGDGWIDSVHTFLSVEFCQPSVWFDSFFSDKRVDEEERAGTHVRWQNDYVLTKGGVWTYTSNIHASFKLPKTKKSIHIIFEGEEEENLSDVVPVNQDQAKGDLGLLYAITKSDRVNFSIRLKLSPSMLVRYRYTWPVTESFTTRFTHEIYQRDDADNTVSRIDFEKKISDIFLLRQSNSLTHSEIFEGEKWNSSLVLYQYLTEKSALSYESSTTRLTEPSNYVQNSRIGVRYRRNAYRKWLFYEIAPAVNWDRVFITDERKAAWEILFRLEVNFTNL